MRVVPRILVCLVIGLTLTTLTAWGCAIFSRHARTIDFEATAEWKAWWAANVPAANGGVPDEVCIFSGFGITEALVQARDAPKAWRTGTDAVLVEVGWPWRCFHGSACTVRATNVTTFDGMVRVPAPEWASSTLLPLRPSWFGLAGNTLLAAFLCFAPFYWLHVIRHDRALRRGRCPRCAYPVGSTVACSECGALLVPRRRPRERLAPRFHL